MSKRISQVGEANIVLGSGSSTPFPRIRFRGSANGDTMPIHQVPGLGWLPDLPDHRDKNFTRAIENMRREAPSASAGEAPVQSQAQPKGRPVPIEPEPEHTYQGWKLSAKRMLERLEKELAEREAGRRDKNAVVERRRLAAMAAAFGDEERPLLLEEPPAASELPDIIDLRPFMSSIEDQEQIGSCTAHAVIGLAEYLQIATQGQYIDASRLFLYKATRDLLQWVGDTGAFIRETIKAMALFGVCPEQYLPYDITAYDAEPSPFSYAFSGNYKALSYYRLEDLEQVRRSLAQGYPVAFGFTCYESIDNASVAQTGIIPYPVPGERSVGGHAVLAVGYIDDAEWFPEGVEGVIIIRNSWGADWGQDGYGFLPYSYFPGGSDRPAADDFWTMTHLGFTDLSDTQAPPFAMGRAPRTFGGRAGPPRVFSRAKGRPRAQGNVMMRRGAPVFSSDNLALGGGRIFGRESPLFTPSPLEQRDSNAREDAGPITDAAHDELLEQLASNLPKLKSTPKDAKPKHTPGGGNGTRSRRK